MIHGQPLEAWCASYPVLEKLIAANPCLWINPDYRDSAEILPRLDLTMADITEASQRLQRFAPYLAKVFPETVDRGGIIESPLRAVPRLQQALRPTLDYAIPGRLLLKCDNELAIAGSVKARGGIYEVLKFAEGLALEQGIVEPGQDYSCFNGPAFKQLFSEYSIAVGSTGNLGLGIGIISAQLGFRVYVHMSADARQWKKDLLRARGVEVIEYQADYGAAVERGRAQASADPRMHFVDDENSLDLFVGYAVAALRLRQQLEQQEITVNTERPLMVYLPCGVGGAPGGIAFGLKQVFGDAVHCFFAEPVASPCMLLGLMTGLHERVNVRDFGLDNATAADGLAVASPSVLVCRLMRNLVSGCYSVQDDMLFKLLVKLRDVEQISLEPSALAGLTGPAMLWHSETGRAYLETQGLTEKLPQAAHLAWLTGGSLLPDEESNQYYQRGIYSCA